MTLLPTQYFGDKRVETGPNCSHELATFLKYHMLLTRDGRVANSALSQA